MRRSPLRPIAPTSTLLLALSIAACAPSPTVQASGNANGVSFEVWGTQPAIVKTVNGDIDVTFGDNHLEVQNGKARYNGKDYGAVKSGDKVVVDPSGAVLINGQKRLHVTS